MIQAFIDVVAVLVVQLSDFRFRYNYYQTGDLHIDAFLRCRCVESSLPVSICTCFWRASTVALSSDSAILFALNLRERKVEWSANVANLTRYPFVVLDRRDSTADVGKTRLYPVISDRHLPQSPYATYSWLLFLRRSTADRSPPRAFHSGHPKSDPRKRCDVQLRLLKRLVTCLPGHELD